MEFLHRRLNSVHTVSLIDFQSHRHHSGYRRPADRLCRSLHGVSLLVPQFILGLTIRLGIPGQYDTDLFHSTVAKIAGAADKASVNGREVFIGLGGLEPRPDLLETFAMRHPRVR